MSTVFAPLRLTLAPRPLPTELISSWLLRVSAANCVTLAGATGRLPISASRVRPTWPLARLRSNRRGSEGLITLLSCTVGETFRRRRSPPFASFECRFATSVSKRAPCSRVCRWRLRYAFCPKCLAEQHVTHIPWEWSLACLTICKVHRVPLLDACPDCGAVDPLTFTAMDQLPSRVCCSCAGDLTKYHNDPILAPEQQGLQTVEDAYRASLLGIAPILICCAGLPATPFRMFVDDLLQILTYTLNACSGGPNSSDGKTELLARQDLLRIIADLILHAAPSCDVRQRRSRYARSLVLS